MAKNPVASFKTSMGTIKAEIYLDRVPRTASNFIDLANSGFYNGLHFHRVAPLPACDEERRPEPDPEPAPDPGPAPNPNKVRLEPLV